MTVNFNSSLFHHDRCRQDIVLQVFIYGHPFHTNFILGSEDVFQLRFFLFLEMGKRSRIQLRERQGISIPFPQFRERKSASDAQSYFWKHTFSDIKDARKEEKKVYRKFQYHVYVHAVPSAFMLFSNNVIMHIVIGNYRRRLYRNTKRSPPYSVIRVESITKSDSNATQVMQM